MKSIVFTFIALFFTVNAYAWCKYSEVSPGQPLEACICNSSTPAKVIKWADEMNCPVTILSEKKDSKGIVVSVTIQLGDVHSFNVIKGISITHWFRSEKACQEARKMISIEKKARENEINENLKKRYSPYE
jgi:hypothetical protein